MLLLSSASTIKPSGRAETALLTAAVALPVALLVKRFFLSHKQRLPYPPGPTGHAIFGNMFELPDFEKGETYDTQNLKIAKEYGLIYSVNIPLILGRLIIIGDPELAKRVLVTKNYPKSFFYKLLAPILGPQSLVTLKGEEWAGMRKAFNPGFAPLFLKHMTQTMAEKLERFIQNIDQDIQADQATNMLLESQSFTSDVIVQIAFGEDWGNTGEPHPARKLEDEICTLYSSLVTNPLRRICDFRTKRKMYQVGIKLDEEMRAILDRRLAAAANVSAGNGNDSRDILSLAIAHLTKEGGGSLTEQDKDSIVDQLKTFYFAGHDTTATTIAWAMWELSQHPEALKRVRLELEENGVWADYSNVPPTYEQLQACVYLEAVIKETLRLYPPASGLSRQCHDANESYNGYCIGNSVLLVNAYVMHRHPDLWKRPDEFVPERFIDGSEEDINSKFMPFSRGKRDCIGKYFALLEAKLAVSALAMRYDLECDDPTDHIFQLLTNIPKKGAKVKFSPRAT
jgi:cytochrome P450